MTDVDAAVERASSLVRAWVIGDNLPTAAELASSLNDMVVYLRDAHRALSESQDYAAQLGREEFRSDGLRARAEAAEAERDTLRMFNRDGEKAYDAEVERRKAAEAKLAPVAEPLRNALTHKVWREDGWEAPAIDVQEAPRHPERRD